MFVVVSEFDDDCGTQAVLNNKITIPSIVAQRNANGCKFNVKFTANLPKNSDHDKGEEFCQDAAEYSIDRLCVGCSVSIYLNDP